MRNDIDQSKEQIISWLEEGLPRFEICRRLKCKYDTLKSRLIQWGINLKNAGRKGIPHLEGRRPASDYLGVGKKRISSHKLKLILLREKIKEEKCEICSLEVWQGKKIPIELDHINGDHWDNRLENLRILCPNCHAQTATNSGKNIKKI